MSTQTSTITWMKNNRVGPVFLMISLFLEALYLFQPLVDSGLNQMFQSFQRMGIDAFDSKSILPLMIYIFVVKLSFLWRIPFLVYGFLWVKAIAKDSRGTVFQISALLLFVLPFYLALFLMPFPTSSESLPMSFCQHGGPGSSCFLRLPSVCFMRSLNFATGLMEKRISRFSTSQRSCPTFSSM